MFVYFIILPMNFYTLFHASMLCANVLLRQLSVLFLAVLLEFLLYPYMFFTLLQMIDWLLLQCR